MFLFEHVWIVLESFGTILGVFWDMFGTFWELVGNKLENVWEVLGTFLGTNLIICLENMKFHVFSN